MKKIKISILALAVLFAGCGDESYNCATEDMAEWAFFVKHKMYYTDTNEEKAEETLSDYLKFNKISIELLNIDDNVKKSICRAKFTSNFNMDNERESEIVHNYCFFKLGRNAESYFTEAEKELLKNMAKNNAKGSFDISYEVSDNGRGESLIRILKK